MSIRTITRGSTEYLRVTVTCDVQLTSQSVAFSFDRSTWIPAEWEGSAGTTRTARALVSTSALPANRAPSLYVRVTDNPEIPVIRVDGHLEIV